MSKTYSTTGLDGLPHAITCEFITNGAILPCICDATRKPKTWWYQCWRRWLLCCVVRSHLAWPIEGPDGTPWVPGYDFNAGE